MKIKGKTIRITPMCVENRGNPGVIDYAFSLIKPQLERALKNCPSNDFEVSFSRIIKDDKE